MSAPSPSEAANGDANPSIALKKALTDNAQTESDRLPVFSDEMARRGRVLDTACTLLRQHGFHATSMDCIARHAGMSKKTLYQLFTSKQNLFEQLLLERLFLTLGPGPLEGPEMETALIAHFRHLAKVLFNEERLDLLRAVIGETNRSDAIQSLMAEALHLSNHKTGVVNWLQARQAEGQLRPGDAVALADHLFGVTLGVPLLSRLTHCVPPRTAEALDLFICEGVHIFLRAWRINA